MKKLVIILVIIALVRIGSLVYYESKVLEEPIIVASDYDEAMGMITVSYITNRLDPHDVAWVEMGDLAFGPESSMDMNFFDPQSSSAVKFADYTYHSIYYSQMHIGYPDDGGSLEIEDEMTVRFTDSSFQQVSVDKKVWDEESWLSTPSNTSEAHQTVSGHIVERSFQLEEIQIDVGQRIHEMKVNTDLIQLPLNGPLELKKGDRISLTTSNRNAMYLGDWMYVYLLGTDEDNQSIEMLLPDMITSPPSESWINQLVKEAQEQ